jgi:uncharacterized membrane protein YhaH (DUF805 family)
MSEKKPIEKNKKLLWFRAKDYGWGWYPVTWEGWTLTLGYIVIAVGGAMLVADNQQSPLAVLFFPFILVLTTILLFTCYYTGEKPEWRWGGKPLFKKK